MKKSNKLLIVLVTIIFIIPLFVVMGFKSAIRENRYVVKNMFGVKEAAFKSLKPFKVVKLSSSIGHSMMCNIKSGNKYEYKFVNYNSEKSVKDMPNNFSVDVIADTLLISYNAKDGDQYLLELDLSVPDGVSVIAEGAKVAVNTIKGDSPKNILVDLSKDAELIIKTGFNRDGNTAHPEQEKFVASNYTIKSVDALVSISASIQIRNIKIEADNSQIFIGPDVVIDSLSGSLSPETIVNAPYKFVQHLK